MKNQKQKKHTDNLTSHLSYLLRPWASALAGAALGTAAALSISGCTFSAPTNETSVVASNESTLHKSAASYTVPDLKSNNWSGYVTFPFSKEKAKGNITEIKGTWAVAVANQYDPLGNVEQWIGLGGYLKNDGLIQAGTGFSDRTGYYAWYELLFPSKYDPEVILKGISVKPNDIISCDIKKVSDGLWNIKIKDSTTGKEVSEKVKFNQKISTAEWIVESPIAYFDCKNKLLKAPAAFHMHLSQFGSTYFGGITNKAGSDYVAINGVKYNPASLNHKSISISGVSVSRMSQNASFEVSDHMPSQCVNGFLNDKKISVGKPLKTKDLEIQLVKTSTMVGIKWAQIFTTYTENIPGLPVWRKTVSSGGVTEFYQTVRGGGVVQCSNLSYVPLGMSIEIPMMLGSGRVEDVYIYPAYLDKKSIAASVILEAARQ